MANRDELISVLRSLLTEQFAPKPRYVRAVLGDGRGNVVVPGNPDRSYARFTRDSTTYFEVFNRTVNPVNDWPILVGELPWQPGLTQVVDTDWSVFEQSGWGDDLGNTSPHAPTHVRRDGSIGSDPLDVYLPMLAPARAYTTVAAPSTVYVNALEYGTTGTFWQGLPGIDLQPLMDATVTGTMRFAGVYIDTATNTLAVVTGSTTVHTSAFDPPRVSFPATNAIPVARIKLYGGQAVLSEVNDFRDARRLFSVGGSGGGAPSGPAGGDLDGTYPNPSVDGLRGYGLANVAPAEGQVLMFSGSAWRPVGEKGPGWPTVRTVNPAGGAHYTSLSAALSAANVGDVIELYGDVTVTTFELNKAVTVRGVSQDITITITTGSTLAAGIIAGAYITAAATLENITIVSSNNTTTNHAVFCDANCTLRNVIASATASTNRRGITVNTARTVELIECEGTATGGGGDNTALLVSATGNIRGGKFNGGTYDIYVSSSSTANLNHPPYFVNNRVYVDSTGSMLGDYVYNGDLLNRVRVHQAAWFDYALVDRLNVSGIASHFKDNDSSYPDGWTETDAPSATNTNAVYSFWQITSASGNATYDYKIQTAINIESLAADAFSSFQLGPVLPREFDYGGDKDWYFGVYRDSSGIDTATFVLVHLQWNNTSKQFQVRTSRKDGTTQTDGSWVTLPKPMPKEIWLRVMLRNDTNKLGRGYVGQGPLPNTQLNLMSANVGASVTWGQVWLRHHHDAGSGFAANPVITIGAVDYLAGTA